MEENQNWNFICNKNITKNRLWKKTKIGILYVIKILQKTDYGRKPKLENK